MSNKTAKSMVAALGTFALASPLANAAENPFQMVEFGEGITVATEARDMQGNKIMIDDQTGFEYGGDNKGKYAGGKIGTGKKDPAVCGTYSHDTCSIDYVEK